MPSPETSSAVMWLSSAGMGMLAPGKQVGNAAIVPSFVKVPCTISSISAFASGECMSYLVFFFSPMVTPYPHIRMGKCAFFFLREAGKYTLKRPTGLVPTSPKNRFPLWSTAPREIYCAGCVGWYSVFDEQESGVDVGSLGQMFRLAGLH